MKKIFCFLFLILLLCGNAHAQTDRPGISRDTVYTLLDDTLYSNIGFAIIVGQKLLVGKGSEEKGWYMSMWFKSPFNWSLWLFRDAELNTSTNPSRIDAAQERENNKLKNFLHEGDSLVIKKIRKKGNKKYGYWYAVYLKDTKFPITNFICNIEVAIKTKEIIIQ
jgi:hypothetical protein